MQFWILEISWRKFKILFTTLFITFYYHILPVLKNLLCLLYEFNANVIVEIVLLQARLDKKETLS